MSLSTLKETLATLGEVDIRSINVDDHKPDKKDHDRASDMAFHGSTFHGNGAPFQHNATKMAAAIKDPHKLIRRAKAVVKRWGHEDHVGLSNGGKDKHRSNMWKPFQKALEDKGFSAEQIAKIRQG